MYEPSRYFHVPSVCFARAAAVPQEPAFCVTSTLERAHMGSIDAELIW